jgi:YidC/Oxa1 family membrane protein insertase
VERRQSNPFLTWLVLTFAMFFLWTSLRQQFAPPKPKAPPVASETEEGTGAATAEVGGSAADKPDTPAAEPVQGKQEWFTLGTMNKQDGYRLLVTLNSKGAGIERIELVEQKPTGDFVYRSLATLGGSIGYLALTEVEGGLVVNSVPAGSSAAAASPDDSTQPVGLQVADVIVGVDDKVLMTLREWETFFEKRKPGTKVKVKVRRTFSNASQAEFAYDVVVKEQPLEIVRVADDSILEEVVGNEQRLSCLTTLAGLNGRTIAPGKASLKGLEATLNGYWLASPIDVEDGMGIEFTMPLAGWLSKAGVPANLEIVKRYRLRKATENAKDPLGYGYCVDFETVIRNLDDKAHEVSLRQEGVNGLTLEAWWYAQKISPYFMDGAGTRDVVLGHANGMHNTITRSSIFKYAQSNETMPDKEFLSVGEPMDRRSFRYLGVDTPYFVSAFLPHPEQPDSLSSLLQGATRAYADVTKFTSGKALAGNVGFWFATDKKLVEPKGEVSQRYLMFAGPKKPEVLEAHQLSSCIEFGWFGFVAKPLLAVLHFFYAIVQNYGIAIIMLTVLVRGCMFPLSRKAALSAQKMQELAPELKRINEQFKDDPTRKIQETQAIYKKYKFNPAAGCLPVFIQIPIFIGLYRAVSVDIELRQQPLIPGLQWCSNLAGPDMFYYWANFMPDFIAGKGSGWFGPYFNLLPIATITLFIIQQKVLMPKATDEQTRLTQTMMMYMTVFMGVLFFKVPAGLCIYFITSSLWSLVERKLVKKFTPATALATDVATVPAVVEPVAEIKKKPQQKYNARPETLSEAFPWMKKFLNPENQADKGKANVESKPPNASDVRRTGGKKKKKR